MATQPWITKSKNVPAHQGKNQYAMHHIDKEGVSVTVYLASKSRGGVIWAIKQAIEDLHVSRYVIARLFWRDFVAQFRQKIFGYFWALLGPLFGVFSFLFLYFVGVLKPGQGQIPYVAYVLIGSTIWSCLPAAMSAVATGLQSQADLVLRTRIPKLALALSSLSAVLYGTLISIVTILVIMFVLGMKFTLWLLLYPVLVLPMILMGVSVGLILSVLGAVAKDLTQIVTQVLAIAMYLTPVIYLQDSIHNSIALAVIKWNPLSYLVDVPRSLICLGYSDYLDKFTLAALLSVVLVAVGLRIFYLLEDLVAERL